MYKGELKGFPKEVVDKILCYKKIQKGFADVDFFEISPTESFYDFVWEQTIEGGDFWYEVIVKRNFDYFFYRYPKAKSYPRVMLVKSHPDDKYVPRVVFAEKLGKYIAWNEAQSIEDAEYVIYTSVWKYAIDIEEPKNS